MLVTCEISLCLERRFAISSSTLVWTRTKSICSDRTAGTTAGPCGSFVSGSHARGEPRAVVRECGQTARTDGIDHLDQRGVITRTGADQGCEVQAGLGGMCAG
jgi:hypothetical protein